MGDYHATARLLPTARLDSPPERVGRHAGKRCPGGENAIPECPVKVRANFVYQGHGLSISENRPQSPRNFCACG
jgi:hypothetical protein